MTSAESFVTFFKSSYTLNDDFSLGSSLSESFFYDFVQLTPVTIQKLKEFLENGQWKSFYNKINDLKYLCEFSDDLSKGWYLLRAYSGALEKLNRKPTAKNAKSIYAYYFNKYGDRRILKDEHWFEKLRWEFLEELQEIYENEKAEEFVNKYSTVVSNQLEEYQNNLREFILEVERVVNKKQF